jgi:hypothetical protein
MWHLGAGAAVCASSCGAGRLASARASVLGTLPEMGPKTRSWSFSVYAFFCLC